MKTKIAVIVATLALAFTVTLPTPAKAQSTNAPVALTVPPIARPVQQIIPVKLNPTQSAAFLAAISAVVTLPAGTIPIGGGYHVNSDGTVTIYGSVKPTAPVTSQ